MFTEDICIKFKDNDDGHFIRGVYQINWYDEDCHVLSIYQDEPFEYKNDEISCIICGLR